MTAITLSPTERREHRAAAHHLQPTVMIGAEGLTDGVAAELERALAVHGLVKVRVASEDRAAREALLAQLAEAHGAAPVQHIGRLLVLWRPPLPKEPTASDGGDRGRGSRVVKLVKFSKSGTHRPEVKKVTLRGNERVTAGGLVKRARPTTGSASTKKRAQSR